MIRIGKKPQPTQFNPRSRNSISLDAQKAKKRMDNTFPGIKIQGIVPWEYLNISVRNKKSQEGSVRLSTLFSIPSGAAGFLTGSYLYFKYVVAESIAKQLGVNEENLEFFKYLLDPGQNTERDSIMSYLSIIGAGGVLAFFTTCIPLIPRGFNGSGPQKPE